jgi:hypothetical protein
MLKNWQCSAAHHHRIGRYIAAALVRVYDREDIAARLAGGEAGAVERDGGGVRAIKT